MAVDGVSSVTRTALKPSIVIDASCGAAAPGGIVAAAARMARLGVARVVLVGDLPTLQSQLNLVPYNPMTLRLVGAQVPPVRGLTDARSQAALARAVLPVAMALLSDGEADALITAAPQDIVYELAQHHLRRLPGCDTLASAAVFPTVARTSRKDPLALLLDVSGQRTRSADDLVAFARLGSTYSRVVTGVAQPSVALLSTGLDPQDGPADVVQAHARLRVLTGLHFVGNVRAVDLSRGLADVVVADGLQGHTVRGLLEGLATLTVEAARYAWKARLTWRIGLRLLARGVAMLRKVSEFREYGGAPVLGLAHLVLVTNPDAREVAFENALKLAARCLSRDLQGELAKAMAPAPPIEVVAAPARRPKPRRGREVIGG